MNSKLYGPAALLTLLLGSCSIFSGIDERRPSNWPVASQSTSACPDISGTYENVGSFSYAPTGGAQLLATRFGLQGNRIIQPWEKIEKVSLKQPNSNSISIEGFGSAGFHESRVLSSIAKEFSCENGQIVFPVIQHTVTDGTGTVSDNRYFRLTKADDGSLVGEERWTSTGLAFWIIPGIGSQTFWFRWQQPAK
jgi:hypothetical protein